MRALTRVTAAALLLALLLFAAPVLAAGSSADPLVTVSSAERWAEGVLSDAKDDISSALAGNSCRSFELGPAGRLRLEGGASLVLLEGSARMEVSGRVINASRGAAAVSGSVNPGELYIAAPGSSASLSGNAEILVWGGAKLVEGAEMNFTDVAEGSWYYDYVRSAVAAGLIDGVTETTFEPESGFTRAQAVKIAACLHQYYHTGSVTLTNGAEFWASTYIEYAVSNGVAAEKYASMGVSELNAPINRLDFALLFYYAMPESEYAPINSVVLIPDVTADSAGAAEIYTLYRAGILDGKGEDGSYEPQSGIRRCEAAAILARMLDESLRVAA